MRENMFFGFMNNKWGQPAVPLTDQSLCYLLFQKYIIQTLFKQNFIFYLVSVAEETGLSLILSDTQKNRLDITNMINNLDRINGSFICI